MTGRSSLRGYLPLGVSIFGLTLLTACPFSTEQAAEDMTPPEIRFAIKYAGEAEYEFIGNDRHEATSREFDLACVAAHGKGVTRIDLRNVVLENKGDAPLNGGCNAVYQLPTLLGLERGSKPVDMGDATQKSFFALSLFMRESAPSEKASNYKASRSPVFASAIVRYSPKDCESNIWDALSNGAILEKPLPEQLNEVKATTFHCRAFAWAPGVSSSGSMTLHIP